MNKSRLLHLYLRSRRSSHTILVLLGLAAAIWLLLAWIEEQTATKLLLTVLPLAPATIVGAALRTPFGETERAAGQPLPRLRLVHLGLLIFVAEIALALANLPVPGDDLRWLLLRNGAGYAGLALVGTCLFGAPRAWIAPLLYGIFATVASGNALSRDSRWLWPILPPDYRAAALIAAALLLGGLLVGVLAGPRAAHDELTLE